MNQYVFDFRFFYLKVFAQIPETVGVYRQSFLLGAPFEFEIGVCAFASGSFVA